MINTTTRSLFKMPMIDTQTDEMLQTDLQKLRAWQHKQAQRKIHDRIILQNRQLGMTTYHKLWCCLMIDIKETLANDVNFIKSLRLAHIGDCEIMHNKLLNISKHLGIAINHIDDLELEVEVSHELRK